MRVLNNNEMEAVAGGQAHAVTLKAEIVTKPVTKAKTLVSVPAPAEEEPIDGDGDGGDGGGGGYGGDGDGGGGYGGDYGDGGDGGGASGDDTGFSGGDDGHGNSVPGTGYPVDDAQNDIELAKAEANPKTDIGLTCNTENGSKTCIAGNAEHFIFEQVDKNGNTTTVACSLNAGYNVTLSLDLFKAVRGGSGSLSFTSSPSFTCTPVVKHG